MNRRRRIVRTVVGALSAGGALVFARSIDLVDGRGFALLLGVVATAGFARRMAAREAAGSPGPFSRAMIERPTPAPTNRLTDLERSLDLATISASDANHVLRPLVADVAGSWLQATHGVGLETPAARALLPAEVWAWADPDAPRPADPHGPGITPDALDVLIAQLEALP